MVIFSWYHDLGFENNSGTNCEYLRQSMPVSFAKHCMVLACKQMLPPFVTRWKWQPGMRFKIYWNPVEIQKKMLKSNINQQQCCFIWYCSIFHWQIDLIVFDTVMWIFIPPPPALDPICNVRRSRKIGGSMHISRNYVSSSRRRCRRDAFDQVSKMGCKLALFVSNQSTLS